MQTCKKTKSLFPSNYELCEANTECYPEKGSITATETGGKVSLQELLNHTTRRILEIKGIEEKVSGISNLISIPKWGFDRASSQSIDLSTKIRQDH